jgi:hypothetical protein
MADAGVAERHARGFCGGNPRMVDDDSVKSSLYRGDGDEPTELRF